MGEQFHSRHMIHPNIQDCDGDRMNSQVSEKRVRFTERLDFKPDGPKNPDDGFPNRLVVIDKANNGRSVTHPSLLACQPGAAQSDLSPGSGEWRHFTLLQDYHELRDRGDPELLHYVGTMSLDGFFGHSQLTANLFIEHSCGYKLHDKT